MQWESTHESRASAKGSTVQCPLHHAPPCLIPRLITTATKSGTWLDLKNMLNSNRKNCEQIFLALSRWPRESRRVGFWARSPPSFPTKLSDRRSFQQPSAYAKTQIRTSSTKCASISHRRVFCTNNAVFVQHIASFNIFGLGNKWSNGLTLYLSQTKSCT